MEELPNIRAIAAAFVAISFAMLCGLAFPRGDLVMVVGRPGITEAAMMDMIGTAGGSFVSRGRFGWAAVAHAESSGFALRLLETGALLVLDHSLASGCLERND